MLNQQQALNRGTNGADVSSYGHFLPAGTIVRADCGDSARLCNCTGSYYGRAVYDEGG